MDLPPAEDDVTLKFFDAVDCASMKVQRRILRRSLALWSSSLPKMNQRLFFLAFLSVSTLHAFSSTPIFGAGGNKQQSGPVFSSSDSWMESLRARQAELESQKNQVETKWRDAECHTSIPLSLPDWIRRLDLSEYPVVACGTSSGNIFVANLESGKVLAQTSGNELEKPLEDIDDIIQMLFNGYDGGGTLAVKMDKTLICSAGRKGSVQVWRVDVDRQSIVSQGSLPDLEGTLVTCLDIVDDYLWIGTADGKLMAYDVADLPLVQEPELSWDVQSPILSMSLNLESGYGCVTTANWSACLFSLEDDARIIADWKPPFDFSSRTTLEAHLTSSAIIPYKDGGYVMAAGSSTGSIYLKPLNWESGMLDESKPLRTATKKECLPNHSGPVKCLTSPSPGLMLSGGQDGSIRLWDVSEDAAKFLYSFVGYKVWLGSVWTDGERLVSDGADNTVVVHDFAKKKKVEN